jgi:nucleotide-binding universal stress UspA family protein
MGTVHALGRHTKANGEPVMNENSQSHQPSRIVLVVGVDMSDVSEHLLTQTRALIRPVDEAEVHVVHVISPEPPFLRLVRPKDAKDAGAVYEVEHAQSVLERLSAVLMHHPRTRVTMHTPVGNVADQLTRIAAEVGADILVVEAHEHDGREPLRMFHRSVLDQIASAAPCSVLTIRKPRHVAEAPMATDSTMRGTWPSASR